MVLMDVLVSHVGDEYEQVSVKCQRYVTECQQVVDGLTEMLEERIYELSTKLPRLLSASGIIIVHVLYHLRLCINNLILFYNAVVFSNGL